jgi:HPt (histidine-containing phosphotransfer) domain-containing protein
MTAHAMQGDRERCLAAGMDGYVAKPMKAGELYAAIDSLLQGVVAASTSSDAPPIDLPAALSIVDGDRDLLLDLIVTFLEDYPKSVAELESAIRAGDTQRMAHVAHSLKGSVVSFGAKTASTLAHKLETMGRQAELEDAPLVLQQLAHELERIAIFVTETAWDEQICATPQTP